MVSPEPPREPPRVRLRAASPSDVTLLRRWRAEGSVRRYQPLRALTTAELRTEVAGQKMEDLRRGQGEKFQWIVLSDERPAGWVTLVVTNWEHGLAEVGYSLASAYQGRGIMAPALEQLLAEVFGHTGLARVEARCAVDNVASQRVLERLGFQREGLLRGYFVLHGRRVDNYLYAILREEYSASREAG